jgi:hypothetical protein
LQDMKVIRNIFISLLIATVFVSGNGVVLAIHTCLSSSEKTVSLFETHCSCKTEDPEKCHKPAAGELKNTCCSFELSYLKLNTPVTAKKIQSTDNSFPVFFTVLFTNHETDLKVNVDIKDSPRPVDIPVRYAQLLI